MRPPTPRSLLVEHPALPQPFEPPDRRRSTTGIRDLDLTDRFRVAVQLVALTALLADNELWPGRRSLRRAVVEITGDGPSVRLPAPPVSLPRLWSRLGGGDPAAETTKAAVLATIAELTGLEGSVFEFGGGEPGFFFDGVLTRLLREIGRPLDTATARSLWLWRWGLPAPSEIGDTTLLAIPDRGVAGKVGAAMWAASTRGGTAASLEIALPGRRPKLVAGGGTEGDLRFIAGDHDERFLASIINGGVDRHAGVVILGRFPDGWNPIPAPIVDAERLSLHLALAGTSPARRLRFIDRQTDRFDPFSPADRRSLTRAAAGLFSRPRRRYPVRFAELARVAALAPEGVPIDRFLELAGATESDLHAACEEGAVIRRHDRILAPDPVAMKVDPRHARLVDLHDSGDPLRLLHEALASGNPGPLIDWARSRLDDLDCAGVRSVLTRIAVDALGPAVRVILAHACLGLADIHGARRALAGLSDELARPWASWLRLIDRSPDFEVEFPRLIDVRQAPRACAEIALVGLRRALWGESGSAEAAQKLVRDALPHLDGLERRWIEIRLAALVEPERLDDGLWRRTAADGHPELIGLIVFERSVRATFEGRSRLAKRLLRRVMSAERAPGRRALMQVNLGVLEADDGRHMQAEALTLGAYRLFQAAGFRHRVWDVLFNLAVADIDQLRVDRAAARLDEVAKSENTLFVEAERARLALAVGDLELFRRRLVGLPSVDDVSSPQIVEALSFLYGAEALFFESPPAAAALLAAGGPEGSVWLELAETLDGRKRNGDASAFDGWGVRRAADLVREIRGLGSSIVLESGESDPLDVRTALALALCRQLGVRPGWPGRRLRRRAAEVLARHGLTGWATRTRWQAGEVEEVIGGFSDLIRARISDRGDSGGIRQILDTLGIEGLVVYSTRNGSELWRAGTGEPALGHTRGALEIVPLGMEPVTGPVWDLLVDLLELTLPAGGTGVDASRESEVRVDGISPATARLRDEVRRAAGPRFTVLVHGETGSGKDLVARELHRLSGRTGELVTVNVAAVPGTLLEAELFGSVKGAFTGADRSRRGLVAAAEGGSLFLDEVGDLDLALQVKLLRFLESGEVRQVGSDQTRHVDIRVICATHRNLERRVREGRFREDLYYRMALAKVEVPALRERIEDIPVLRSIFEEEASRRHGLPISPWTSAAESRLMRHHWPGNVRELKHTVEVAMARASGAAIRPEHLPFSERRPRSLGTWETALEDFRRRLLTEVLTRHRGNRSAAARELDISRQALLYQLRKLGITEL